jgi:hypothetical protein
MATTVLVPLLLFGDEAARICSRTRSLIEEGSPEKILSAIPDIVRACNDLESSTKDHFGDVMACPALSSAAQSIAVEDQSSLSDLRLRNHIDACFLRLHYSILELLFYAAKLLDHTISQHEDIAHLRRASILQSRARADRILMTLPRFMPKTSARLAEGQEIRVASLPDILRLMWPVRLIASSPVVHERQKTTAKSVLSRIGYEVGIMQAVGTYYTSLTANEAL